MHFMQDASLTPLLEAAEVVFSSKKTLRIGRRIRVRNERQRLCHAECTLMGSFPVSGNAEVGFRRTWATKLSTQFDL